MVVLFDHLVLRGEILDSNRVAPGSTREERHGQRALTARNNEAEKEKEKEKEKEREKEGANWLTSSLSARDNNDDEESDRVSTMAQGMGGVMGAMALGPQMELAPPGSSPAGKLPESVVDMSAPDRGYSEWLEDVWAPFLRADPVYASAEAATEANMATKQGRTSKPERTSSGPECSPADSLFPQLDGVCEQLAGKGRSELQNTERASLMALRAHIDRLLGPGSGSSGGGRARSCSLFAPSGSAAALSRPPTTMLEKIANGKVRRRSSLSSSMTLDDGAGGASAPAALPPPAGKRVSLDA
jgi:hypothetical protein